MPSQLGLAYGLTVVVVTGSVVVVTRLDVVVSGGAMVVVFRIGEVEVVVGALVAAEQAAIVASATT